MSIIGRKFDYYNGDKIVEATIIDKFDGIARFNSYGDTERDGRPANNIISVTYYKCAMVNDDHKNLKLFDIRADCVGTIKS